MYRGREGQWAFILHRVAGIGLVLYLLLHVVDISLVMFGPEGPFNAFLAFYHQWPFRVGLLAVIAASLYHAFNGLRIILMDLTDWGVRYQRAMWYGAMGLTLVLFGLAFAKIAPEIVRGL